MHSPHLSSDPITLVISEVVKPDRIADYEAWTKGINQAAAQFEGFLGVEVIRPRDRDHPEYVVIVKFDRYDHLRQWSISPIYQHWLSRVRDLCVSRSYQELPDGLEMWFTLPNQLYKPPQPPYYKQVALGVLSVYPLILLANLLLAPFLQGFHPLLSLFISVIFVSALLTYPVMPGLTRLLGFWLYPSLSRRSRRSNRSRRKA